MIERKFVDEKVKEFQIQEFVTNSLKNVGHSHTKLQRTPLGEKIIVYASRPGLVVGRKGENIKKLTSALKKKFHLENPQIEISEVEDIFLDAQIVAEMIASTLERYGPQRFKGVGHRMLGDIAKAKALGAEIVISGKIPGARAKSWRFYQGYMKKCGELAITDVRKACTKAKLKSGIIGIKVSIMPPDIKLPDDIKMKSEEPTVEELPAEEAKEAPQESKQEKAVAEKKAAAEKKVAAGEPEQPEEKEGAEK